MANNLTKRDIVLDIYDKTDFPQKDVRDTVHVRWMNCASSGGDVM